MASVERVTVTLPGDLVRGIDRLEKNRSRFVAEAVRRELERHRREELRRSLADPHAESLATADQGFGDWASGIPAEDAEGLVDAGAATAIRWVPGSGWHRDES